MRMDDFPIVYAFDLLMKDTMDTLDILPRVVHAYMNTLMGYEECRVSWKGALEEINTLSEQLTAAKDETAKLQAQMSSIRRIVDEERKRRKCAECDRDYFESQLEKLRSILKDGQNKVNKEMKQKLLELQRNHLSSDFHEEQLNKAADFETTGSFMTDLSYTRDEDDLLDISEARGQKRTSRTLNINEDKKKRRSSSAMRTCELKSKDKGHLIAATTVTLDQKSNIHATAVLELKPQNENQELFHSAAVPMGSDDEQLLTPKVNDRKPFFIKAINTRPHNFQQKAMLKGEMCNVCSKRLRFTAMGYKCRDCKAICHFICKDTAQLPCVPNASTPCKICDGVISDYAPLYPPMVPSIVIHCIKEIEERGLTQPGLYLIPGSDKEIKALREKFSCGKGVPNLSQIQEVHVICGCLKDFFKSLKDPLTTRDRWNVITEAVEIEDCEERRQKLCHIISRLPQPNRDTLAYLLHHLQRVIESPDCQMPASHLAKVFGSIIIGYSTNEPENVYGETRIANKVMAELLELPESYLVAYIEGTHEEMNSISSPYDYFSSNRACLNKIDFGAVESNSS